jgi:hypothetical protein
MWVLFFLAESTYFLLLKKRKFLQVEMWVSNFEDEKYPVVSDRISLLSVKILFSIFIV